MSFIKKKKNRYVAAYFSNSFYITINEDYPFITKENENIKMNNEFTYAFIHEYWHYLVNISTFSRIREFYLFRNLLAIFSNTFLPQANGKSNGNKNLSKDDSDSVNNLRNLYQVYYGDIKPENLNETDIIQDFFIEDIVIDNRNILLNKKNIEMKKVLLKLSVKTEKNKIIKVNLVLGTNSIDESLANTIDSLFNNEEVENYYSDNIIYLILDKLSFYYFDKKISKYELASLATLSLLTSDPAYSLINIFGDYKNLLKSGLSIEDSLIKLSSDISSILSNFKDILLKELDSFKDVYKKRGISEIAINYIIDNMKILYEKRIKQPLFDLDFFKNGFDQNKSDNLVLKDIVSCEIIQEVFDINYDSIKKDFIATFDLARNNIYSTKNTIFDSLGVLCCQHIFLYYHINYCNNGFLSTDDLENLIEKNLKTIETALCPFYTVCNDKNRINNNINCKYYPWKNYDKNSNNNCWFISGIKSIYGKTE